MTTENKRVLFENAPHFMYHEIRDREYPNCGARRRALLKINLQKLPPGTPRCPLCEHLDEEGLQGPATSHPAVPREYDEPRRLLDRVEEEVWGIRQ